MIKFPSEEYTDISPSAVNPFESNANYYENVVDETKKIGGWEVSSKPGMPTGNRLIKLHRDMEVGHRKSY